MSVKYLDQHKQKPELKAPVFVTIKLREKISIEEYLQSPLDLHLQLVFHPILDLHIQL